MPTLDILEYKIDFLILESNDPKVLIILDRSTYLEEPEKPKLDITLPGFTGSIEVPYVVNGITVVDSDLLKLTDSCDYGSLVHLPDGVYKIRQRVCPHDELFTDKCYLKTQSLNAAYEDILLGLDACVVDVSKLTDDLVAIDILIRSARAEAARANIFKATEKYNMAARKVARLQTIINCK